MKNKILWGLTLLPMLITAVVLKFMPDKVPMHYNAAGEIDRWGSKYENFIFPCMIIFISLFWMALMKHYKNKQKRTTEEKEIREAENNEKVLYYVAVGMAAMYTVLQCFTLYGAYTASKGNMTESAIGFGEVTNILMGIFMIFLGNVLPKAKNNAIAGVRTVWSMHNDITWSKSNRFGGVALMVCGLVTIIETLIVGGFASTMIMLGLIIGFGVAVCVYSYRMYKKYNDVEIKEELSN